MKISASDQVAGWISSLAPEPKRRIRAALKGLEDWQGDINLNPAVGFEEKKENHRWTQMDTDFAGKNLSPRA